MTAPSTIEAVELLDREIVDCEFTKTAEPA
jgi:hypothetical protein